MIATEMTAAGGYSNEQIKRREAQIEKVSSEYGFHSIHRLRFEAAKLDTLPVASVVQKIASIITSVGPSVLYLPFPGDIHTDHQVVFQSAASCTKSFRHKSVRQVLCYEVLSETDFAMIPGHSPFHPNLFVDISAHLEKKIEIMQHYEGEMGTFPHPRSAEAIRALARLRGAVAGAQAAEAFMLLKEIR
jgi:LmbE family N-acetylglucosaminyl deacetylase